MTTSPVLDTWHHIVAEGDRDALDRLLADDAVFRSPAVHAPQEGKPLVLAYLTGALAVLGPTLTYHRTWHAERSAVLEFTARLGDTEVHGVDMIGWNDDDLIDDFTVMVRPVRGLQAVMAAMAAELERLGS